LDIDRTADRILSPIGLVGDGAEGRIRARLSPTGGFPNRVPTVPSPQAGTPVRKRSRIRL